MAENAKSEHSLQRDVEELRERFSATQELYREVAALLFFRYGITPTANRLYQLVRKGSMSAPAQALQNFWEELREKSRVRIDHADLPESLLNKVGDLTSQLWLDALAHAKESYQVFYEEANANVEEALAAQRSLQQQLQHTESQLAQSAASLEETKKREQSLQQELAALRQELVHEKETKDELIAASQSLKLELKQQQTQFTADLDKLQSAITLTEERARASERMALMEIEKERSLRQGVEKTLHAAVAKHKEETAQQQTHQQAIAQEMAVLRHQLKNTQQLLLDAEQKQQAQQQLLAQAQAKSAHQMTQIAVLKKENSFLNQQCTDLQQQLLRVQESRRVVLPRRHKRG